MKKTSVTRAKTLKVLSLVIGLGAIAIAIGRDRLHHRQPATSKARANRIERTMALLPASRPRLADDTQYKYDGGQRGNIQGVVQLSGFVNHEGTQKSRAGGSC